MCSEKGCGYLVKGVRGSTTPAVGQNIDEFVQPANCPGPGIRDTIDGIFYCQIYKKKAVTYIYNYKGRRKK